MATGHATCARTPWRRCRLRPLLPTVDPPPAHAYPDAIPARKHAPMNKALADNRDKALATIDAWAQAAAISPAGVKRITARLLPSVRLVPVKGDTKELGRCRI